MGFKNVGDIPYIPTSLIYGENRAGKTHFGGTNHEVNELQPSLIVDTDRGAVTINKLNPKQLIYQFERKNFGKQIKEIVDVAGDYKCIIVDTLSSFMGDYMLDITGGTKPQFSHWTQMFDTTLKFIRDLKDRCPFVMVTAFPSYIENSEGQTIGVTPLLNGKNFPKLVMNEFNIIGFLSHKSIKKGTEDITKYTLNTRPNSYSTVGDRFGRCGVIEDPTIKKLYDALKGA